MFNKKLIAGSIATAMTVGLMSSAQAIEVAANNVGQLLLAPTYLAQENGETDIVVVNTRTDAAVIAKVVFRTVESSKEALDFFIYLTPGDTWRSTVSESKPGVAKIYSEDDSMLATLTSFASPANPVTQQFADKTADDESSAMGHMEVIGWRSFHVGKYTKNLGAINESSIVVKGEMSKSALKLLSSDDGQGYVLAELQEGDTVENLGCGGPASDRTGQLPGRNHSTVDPCHLQLLGTMTIRQQEPVDSGERMSYEMTALAPSNYSFGNVAVEDDGQLHAGISYPYPNYVVSNSNLTLTVGKESGIGQSFGMSSAGAIFGSFIGDQVGHIVAIENALASGVISWPYEKAAGETSMLTASLVAFPTKYLHKNTVESTLVNPAPGSDLCAAFKAGVEGETRGPMVPPKDFVTEEHGFWYSYPFWTSNVEDFGRIRYAAITCDNSELCDTTPGDIFSGIGSITKAYLPHEVNPFIVDYRADSGWAYIILKESTQNACPYQGVPAISATFKSNTTGNFLWEKSAWRQASFVEGENGPFPD